MLHAGQRETCASIAAQSMPVSSPSSLRESMSRTSGQSFCDAIAAVAGVVSASTASCSAARARVEAALERVDAEPEDLCGLECAEPLEVAQHEHLALGVGQGAQGAVEDLRELAALRGALGARGGSGVILERVERERGSVREPSTLVRAGAPREHEQPARERGTPFELAEARRCGEQRVLDDIVRVRVGAAHAPSEAADPRRGLSEERVERVSVSTPRAIEQLVGHGAAVSRTDASATAGGSDATGSLIDTSNVGAAAIVFFTLQPATARRIDGR